MDLLSKILEVGRGGHFISFANSEGKRWIVPIRSMRTAINLYQPSSIKGKLIKQLLPYTYRLPMVKRMVGFKEMQIALSADLEKLIESVFNIPSFEFSIFGGTPSVHQKITIQISKKDLIIGYCKVSDSNDIAKLFRRESLLLEYLHKKSVNQIPISLFCDKIGDLSIFIQSTTKSKYSKSKHRLTEKHWEFLAILHEKTKITCLFEKSGLAVSLNSLENYLYKLPQKDAIIITIAINRVRSYYGNREVVFSTYHGDFTPWNMFFDKGKLFVFDFEYFESKFPAFMDVFHFITQTAILELKYPGMSIYKYFQKEISTHVAYFDNINIQYISYLLSIVSFYFRIDSDSFGPSDNGYQQWIKLIDITTKQMNS